MGDRKSAAWWRAYRKRRKARELRAQSMPSVHAACDLRIHELEREVATLRDRLALRELFD
jgi:hypothetical protein